MAREKVTEKIERAKKVLAILKRTYPDARCSLTFKDGFELLCATILSAQCTDERVNKVTPALFARFPNARALAEGKRSAVEELVKTTGFFRAKARSLQEMAAALASKHGGEIPRTIEELTALRGVGRKTANVVLGNIYEIPGIVVDTHVGRLARRMGFTRHKDPVKVEHELMEIFPRKDWTLSNHLLIDHGRAICTARKALCEKCPVAALCPQVGI